MPATETLHPQDIVNRALARIGAGEIMSLEDEGDLERQASLIYRTETEWAIGLFPWTFARRTFQLSRLAQPPLAGYRYAYGLPGERLGYPIRYLTNVRRPDLPLRDYHAEGDELQCDAEQVFAVCKVNPAPNLWPPEFRKAVIVLLASALAVPTSHDTTLAAALRREAVGPDEAGGTGGLMGVAIAKETALNPPEAGYATDPFTEARHAGGFGSWWDR